MSGIPTGLFYRTDVGKPTLVCQLASYGHSIASISADLVADSWQHTSAQ